MPVGTQGRAAGAVGPLSRLPTAASPCRPSSCWPKNISIRNMRRKPSRRETGVAADTIRGLAAEIAPRRLRRGDRHRPALDRHERRAARRLRRPAGVVPRHARHLGPFQRLPDGARAAHAAGADRRGRLPRRLPLRAALSEAGRGASDAAWQGRAFRLQQAAVGPASRLSARAGGPADRRRGQADAHRQGVLLGRAALRRTG